MHFEAGKSLPQADGIDPAMSADIVEDLGPGEAIEDSLAGFVLRNRLEVDVSCRPKITRSVGKS